MRISNKHYGIIIFLLITLISILYALKDAFGEKFDTSIFSHISFYITIAWGLILAFISLLLTNIYNYLKSAQKLFKENTDANLFDLLSNLFTDINTEITLLDKLDRNLNSVHNDLVETTELSRLLKEIKQDNREIINHLYTSTIIPQIKKRGGGYVIYKEKGDSSYLSSLEKAINISRESFFATLSGLYYPSYFFDKYFNNQVPPDILKSKDKLNYLNMVNQLAKNNSKEFIRIMLFQYDDINKSFKIMSDVEVAIFLIIYHSDISLYYLNKPNLLHEDYAIIDKGFIYKESSINTIEILPKNYNAKYLKIFENLEQTKNEYTCEFYDINKIIKEFGLFERINKKGLIQEIYSREDISFDKEEIDKCIQKFSSKLNLTYKNSLVYESSSIN